MVGTAVKWGLGAAAIAALIYFISQAKQAAANFGFSIQGYGSPGVNGTSIDLPVLVQFNNPSPVAINIDNVDVKMYLNKGSWVNVANISQPVSLPPGQSTQKINTKIDLGKILGGNILDTLKSALTVYASKVLTVRSDVTVTYQGITLPTQSSTSNIQVG